MAQDFVRDALRALARSRHVRNLETRVSRFGPITRELWRLKDKTLRQLYYWNPSTRRYGQLSLEARRVLRDAHKSITGMVCGPSEYWLPEVMSEAIEAAEALGL